VTKFTTRVLVATVFCTSLVVVAPVVASARGTNPPSPVQLFRAQLRLYNHERVVIDQTFHAAVVSARQTEVAQLRLAKTPAQKSLVRSDYREAVITAATTRANALNALGAAPTLASFEHPTTTTFPLTSGH